MGLVKIRNCKCCADHDCECICHRHEYCKCFICLIYTCGCKCHRRQVCHCGECKTKSCRCKCHKSSYSNVKVGPTGSQNIRLIGPRGPTGPA